MQELVPRTTKLLKSQAFLAFLSPYSGSSVLPVKTVPKGFPAMSPPELVIRGNTFADLRRAVIEAAAAYGAKEIDTMSDEEVLEELRDRMAKQGMVVQVEHFETPGLNMEEAAAAAETDELLSELRTRMLEAHGGIVQIVPFSTVEGDPDYIKWRTYAETRRGGCAASASASAASP
jgi:hypothetical protein